ncbi:PREDICTED: cationic amino acid transporter 2, vacuolar-like [Fragaria vesca subsp. vesca]|uniref:cationic amino acid transporter 2, vacuolar-like n=1 Tax=Fragaria vesca subsp. vesca TaxID=101020 RepID=UPI0002C36A0E|nr:PREDICTED: cationic amino acid transporter 2, vacuolar-like [Fragaria vesca subsp. vesca]
MGFDSVQSVEGWGGRALNSLIRRKQVDSVHRRKSSHNQLAKELTVPHLVAIGVGSTIGAGVYILVGTVAREHSGPALTISFLIAGIAAALSAFCYAELASRCPSAGSAYHYTYICIGEGVAWLVGWALILEYTIGGSAVARGISPNLALLFGGPDSLPFFLSRLHIPALDVVVDPCAAILVFIVTGLLCVGIKESTVAQGIATIANVCAMVFVIVAGTYLGFKTGWSGYQLPTGYFPFGVNGMLAGSATVFFAYIGFDSVASTAEEVKNPQRDLPLGIGAALSICCALYMLVSMVIVGLVPYHAMDPDTPISTAFASHGMQWASYIITVGAVTALCSTLMGSILPQPRILMAMARDGLLPPFFSEINKSTQVPVKSTIATGICAAILAFFMDVSQLAGMVSVGTLVAFTMVAISVLILRYVPPDEVPLPASLQDSIDSVSLRHGSNSQDISGDDPKGSVGSSKDSSKPLLDKVDILVDLRLIEKQLPLVNYTLSEVNRRKIAGWTIMLTCVGVFLLTYSASSLGLPSFLRYAVCGAGGILVLFGLTVLTCIDQDDARHTFGHTGGFLCPFVPLLPIVCILINVYLLINLGCDTWARVTVWLIIGVLVYVCYGRRHSSLEDAVYVPAAHANEIFRSSENYVT